MTILHKENANEGAFYIEEDGQRLAEMDYRKEKDRIIIQHTEVNESLRGKNVGFQLVERGVEYAREANLKIVPLCVFAKKVLDMHKEFQDVL
ncbi:GNAT family N-acetyltransferase [Segetibacter aerophilus]|nr:GNAT family N-acetyltransferase [Segetibacter aerophilus]